MEYYFQISKMEGMFLNLKFKSIRTRILFSFILVLVLVVAMSIYNYVQTTKSVNNTKDIVDYELQLLTVNNNLAQSIALRIAAARGYVLTGDTKYKDVYAENVELALASEEKLLSLTESEEFERYSAMAKEWSSYIQTEVFAVYDNGNKQLAIDNLIKEDATATAIREGYEGLANKRNDLILEHGQEIVTEGERAKTLSIIISVLIIISSIIIASASSRLISAPIKRITERILSIASGNFSEKFLEKKSEDEVGLLTDATNELVRTMNITLKSIQHVSNDLAAHSEELSQSASEVKAGTDQVSMTVSEMASGTEIQAANAAGVAHTMTDFTVKMQDVHERNDSIQHYSTEVMALTTQGQQLMDASTSQMQTIDVIVKDAVTKVDELSVQTKEISTLVQVIHAIADQTNLLSLNAAIEAARAGEHGKGFAVVADEVRKLADQVTHSVDNITTIVEKILAGSNAVMTSLETGYEQVEQGTAQIMTTGETFTKISDALTNMTSNISDMTHKLNEVVENTATINRSVDEIAAVSEQSAAGIEETAATVQQVSSSMDEIYSSTTNLAEMAEQLNNNVRQFKLFNQ